MHTPGDPCDEPEAIWVTSDVADDQVSYVATIHFSDDLSFPLTEAEGLAYVATLLRVCAAAEYDAALFALLTGKLGMPDEEVGPMVAKLRAGRGPGTWHAGPMAVTPGVSVFTRKAFLRCEVRDRKWQWEPVDVQQHARHVLEVAAAVEYDGACRRFLIDEVGLAPELALAVVADVANFR